MSGRPTADIVADLRKNWGVPFAVVQLEDEAIDRLTELDATVAAVVAALDQYDLDLKAQTTSFDMSAPKSCVAAIAKAVRP